MSRQLNTRVTAHQLVINDGLRTLISQKRTWMNLDDL
jgi:hypothetical protein